jgi:hypothetical protein
MRIVALLQHTSRALPIPLLAACAASGAANQTPAVSTPATQSNPAASAPPANPAPRVDTPALAAVVQRYSALLGPDCWSPVLAASAPNLRPGTTLNTAIGVNAQGRVHAVSIAADRNAPASLVQCVEARVRQWQFAGVQGLPVSLTVPLVFVTPGSAPTSDAQASLTATTPVATAAVAGFPNSEDCTEPSWVDSRGIRRLRLDCLGPPANDASSGAPEASPPPSSTHSAESCSPPYLVDSSGIRRLRPECL